MTQPIKHPIRVVSRLTGLSAHVIRAWEKRYQAVSPERTDTNRRLYSEEDIERLQLLTEASRAGWSIGQIAEFDNQQIRSLLPVQTDSPKLDPGAYEPDSASTEKIIENALAAIQDMSGEKLQQQLSEAALAYSQPVLLDHIIAPLMTGVGDRWSTGHVRVAQEHLATAVVRLFLGRLLDQNWPEPDAPSIIVTTPSGQYHEIGALLVAVTAASVGWRAVFLGPNLPAHEIAHAAFQHQAALIALSIGYLTDEVYIADELRQLKRLVSPDMNILIGGRAVSSDQTAINEIKAVHISDMEALRTYLNSHRRPGADR